MACDGEFCVGPDLSWGLLTEFLRCVFTQSITATIAFLLSLSQQQVLLFVQEQRILRQNPD